LDARVKEDPGDYDLIMISSVKKDDNRSIIGKNLVEIAEQWNISPEESVLRLLVEEEGQVGFIGHGMSPENVDMVLSHPLVMIGSDGASMAPRGEALKSNPHPRSYGTCTRVLGQYVRERNTLTLTEAVRKMTSIPAEQTGLRDRGLISKGKKADLVIFDPATVIDRAQFKSPHQFPDGIEHVLVNGQFVIKNAQQTGRKPGRALRRG
jgi:N-acyl-D-amino-acid deacylase